MGATKTACEDVSEEGVQAKKLQRGYTYEGNSISELQIVI